MSFEPVDFTVRDSTPGANPVEGVLVKVYNAAGSLFFTQGTTNSGGNVGFLLETQSYSARFYKYQVGFIQPQLFDVLPGSNEFDITADVFELPLATDPRFCKASGFFRSVTGAPHRGLDIHIESLFDPILLDDAGIVDCKDILRSDENGYVCVDLIRGAEYQVVMECMEDCPRTIRVPDQASVNFPDLVFPIVESASFSPDGPWTVAVGAELEVTPTVIASDGRPLEPATANLDVIWASSDPDVLSVAVSGDVLTLRGVSAGSAQLTAERRDQSIIRIPNTPILGQPVAVTVT